MVSKSSYSIWQVLAVNLIYEQLIRIYSTLTTIKHLIKWTKLWIYYIVELQQIQLEHICYVRINKATNVIATLNTTIWTLMGQILWYCSFIASSILPPSDDVLWGGPPQVCEKTQITISIVVVIIMVVVFNGYNNTILINTEYV